MMNNWICPKCNNSKIDVGEIRTTGGMFSKIFDVQNKKFTTVSCTHCGYTELYKGKSNALGDLLDFFTN